MVKKNSSIHRLAASLNDEPAEQDALNFKRYVATLIDIVASPSTNTPLTIGVFGKWGCGKTSLMRMVRKELPKRCRVAWFDAWKFEKEETIWRAFLVSVLGALRAAVPNKDSDEAKKALVELSDLEVALYRAVDREKVGGIKIDWGKLATGVGQGTMEIALSFIPGWAFLSDLVQQLKGEQSDAAAKNIVEALQRERSKIHIEQVRFLEQFQDVFERLVQDHIVAKKRRLVVFIDDIDRCLPERAVELLEAIKLFLHARGCVFILGLDHEVIGRAIEIKYRDFSVLPSASRDNQQRAFIDGTSYLEKIIQVPFLIPPIEREDMAAFVKGLMDEWPHPSCPEVFAEGLGGNPRQVKRTVNVFLLLWQLSQRIENSDIKPIRLAKVVAIQHAFPDLYKILQDTPRLLRELEEFYRADEARSREAAGRLKEVMPETADAERAVSIASPPVLAPFISRAAGRRLLSMHPIEMPEANFAGIAPDELRLYFTLTRRAEAPQVASAQGPRPFFEPQMIRIAAGVFQMGSNKEQAEQAIAAGLSNEYAEWEQPQHRVALSEYSIGKYPVTNIEYQAFVKDTGQQPPQIWDGVNYPQEKGDHPVASVSWEDAVAYCMWLSEKSGKTYRLPTEAEWEKAARGTDGRIYPWGNVWDQTRLNSAEGGPGDTTPVGQYSPAGDSFCGAADMAGDVWEWCADWFNENEYKKGRENAIVIDPQGPKEGGGRVLRGDSFGSYRWTARCAGRLWVNPYERGEDLGFRVVASSF